MSNKEKEIVELAVIRETLVSMEKELDLVVKTLMGMHRFLEENVKPGGDRLKEKRAVLLQRLDGLTLKRHAVLTATLGGQSYAAIAKAMDCDLTTVKLHLKAALGSLGFRNRSALLVEEPELLSFIDDQEYLRRYGLSKLWWLEEKPQLMAVLRAKKPAKNQHTAALSKG